MCRNVQLDNDELKRMLFQGRQKKLDKEAVKKNYLQPKQKKKMMLQKKLPSKNRKTNKERLVDNHNSRKSLILRIAYSVSALPRLENTSAMIILPTPYASNQNAYVNDRGCCGFEHQATISVILRLNYHRFYSPDFDDNISLSLCG